MNQKNQEQKVVVKITDEGFEPARIELISGKTVTWINKDSVAHWPASDPHPLHDFLPEFDPSKAVAPGESFELKFTKVGEWTYHDHLSPHKRGVVVVKSSTAETPEEIRKLQKEKDPKKQAGMVRGMAEKYGPKQTLEFMKLSGLPFTGETHLLVHEIGNVAYQKYGDDALLYCDESFLSACYHGVIINVLADRGMDGVAKTIDRCKSEESYVLAQCSHAAGHGFLASQDYDIPAALSDCDQLNEIDKDIPTYNCYDGTFMENIFGVHEGKPSEKRWIKEDDDFYPCNAFAEKYKKGCWANQATLLYQRFKGDLRRVASMCDSVKNPELQKTCYDNFARQIHPLTEGKAEKALSMCKNATGEYWQDQCLISIVGAAFSVGDFRAMPYDLCEEVKGLTEKNQCYETVFNNIFLYAKSRQEKSEYCGYIKNEEKRSECGVRFGVELRPLTKLNPAYKYFIKQAKASGVAVAYQELLARQSAYGEEAHGIAHLLGQLAYREQGNDGIKICDNNIGFGCFHGQFEALIRAEGEKGIEVARNACSALGLEGRVVSCLHGIGHGVMGSQGIIDKAIKECGDRLSDFEEIYCFDGAFMEYYSAHENHRETLSFDFCQDYRGNVFGQCVRNHTLHLLAQYSVDQVASMCHKLSGQYINTCVNSIGIFAVQTANVDTCLGLNTSDQAICFTAAAKEFVFRSYDTAEARNLCSRIFEAAAKTSCFAEVENTAKIYGQN